MAFRLLSKAATDITLRSSRTGAVVERYSVIRNFFRQHHEVPSHRKQAETLRRRHPVAHRPGNINIGLRATAFTTLKMDRRLGGPRYLHTTLLRSKSTVGKPPERDKQTTSENRPRSTSEDAIQEEGTNLVPPKPPPEPPAHNFDNYSQFFQRLALSLPHPHRPTRDELLDVATGFWQRTRIRFKWFTIKSFRKFDADDISAFVTWFLMSQTIWILVGT